MDKETLKKIIDIKAVILENNSKISKMSKENERLFKSLLTITNYLSPENKDQKERYDAVLASDNWKIYSKTYRDSIK